MKEGNESMSEKEPICIWCQCPTEEHKEYRSCPLFQWHYLCDVCCDYDIRGIDITEEYEYEVQKALKKRLGIEISSKRIKKICKKCGKGLAAQNYF